MFAALGHQVTGIHRISFGGLTLPGLGLKEGEWRLLTADELAVLTDTSQRPAVPDDVRRTAEGLPPLVPTKMRVRVSIQRERKQEVYAEMVREMERSVAAERASARAGAAGSGAAAAPLR
jgi:type II secretory pathway component HofQ